ncbi:prolyl-tRNA synthetase [Actinoplanes utahensis]|uniref:Prolyl-tRNA synthetase n=1 Tax=Actinoplanes utahensis TaxID=1869 RepID=A0A0A6UR42_ACTUT|nr:prolyl-tRNA synthetase [Actinoplanes utahensis]
MDRERADYRVIDHPAEGHTDLASRLRGHPLAQAAKCLVIRIRMTKKQSRYVLAVVPGHRRVDFARIKALTGARDAMCADRPTAERLSAAVSGAIVPFAFNPALELFADPELCDHAELFFNAATLERSIALRTEDYIRLARPTFYRIAQADS